MIASSSCSPISRAAYHLLPSGLAGESGRASPICGSVRARTAQLEKLWNLTFPCISFHALSGETPRTAPYLRSQIVSTSEFSPAFWLTQQRTQPIGGYNPLPPSDGWADRLVQVPDRLGALPVGIGTADRRRCQHTGAVGTRRAGAHRRVRNEGIALPGLWGSSLVASRSSNSVNLGRITRRFSSVAVS